MADRAITDESWRVIEVEDARLFFPEDRPDTLAVPVLAFWDEVGRP